MKSEDTSAQAVAPSIGVLRAQIASYRHLVRGMAPPPGTWKAATLGGDSGLAPPLLECAAMRKLRHIILSTSTLSSEIIVGGGFGPVNDDCYAIGYGIRSYGCEARVMTYGRDSQVFCDSLVAAMDEMRAAAEASSEA